MVAGGVDVEDEIYVGGDGAGVVEEVVVLVGVCRLNDLAVHPDAMTRLAIAKHFDAFVKMNIKLLISRNSKTGDIILVRIFLEKN